MSAVVREKPSSRPLSVGGTSSHKREVMVFDAASEDAAVAAIIAATTLIPATYTTVQNGITYNFILGTVSAEVVEDGRDPPTTWSGTAQYELQGFTNQPYQTGDNTTTFEIGTQTVNVKQNIFPGGTGIYTSSASGSIRRDFKGLINVSFEGAIGKADGVDIDVPTFMWSETHYIADAAVTTGYVDALFAAVAAPINDDTFRDAAAGEVKIVGVSGTRRNRGGDWELNFKFAASPNIASLTINGMDIAKKGWEYLWFYYKPKIVSDSSSGYTYTIMIAENAYVEQVYDYSDFSTLGIGTT